jgi:hypothetical protein
MIMETEGRIITGTIKSEDREIEGGLRPKFLKDYIGQEKVKEKLKIFIGAAKQRKESLDHVLFYGPPGLGKTTLSNIIANEMNVNIKITSGPAIERPGDLAAILTNLSENDVLFIDEIHRLSRTVEEILYPAMEDFALDIIIGKGPSARSIRLDLSKFTLIGAKYKAEPYVAAADVYTNPQHLGRGGWTWYTGSAGWMYRVGLENILGFRIKKDKLFINPCIPRDWERYEIRYIYGNTVYNIEVKNLGKVNRGVSKILVDGVVTKGYVNLTDDKVNHLVVVELGQKTVTRDNTSDMSSI